MKEHEIRVFEEALSIWGAQNQVLQLYEEISELGIEIAKVRRGRPFTKEDIAGEIADVGIMLDQMIILLLGPEGQSRVADIRGKKIKRLSERIEEYKSKIK